MSAYDRIARAVLDTPWFIREAEGEVMAQIIESRLRGERFEPAEIAARIEAAHAAQGPRRGARAPGPVAIIPVYGVIMPRANLMVEMSGGTSVQQIRSRFREALADDEVASILFEFDSPGGAVDGIEELAAEIRAARGQKWIAGSAHTLAASAAYYLLAQCDEVVASPSAMVGSIGVFIKHTEFSKQDEMTGVTTTIIRRPAAKADVNDSEPLPDAGRAHLEEVAGDYYGQFTDAVAAGRGVTAAAVRAGYGQGRALTAKRAKAAGLVDRIEAFDETYRRLATGKAPTRRASALSLEEIHALPAEQRAQEYAAGIIEGRFSRNGVRTAEGLEPVEGLDELLQPVGAATTQTAAIERLRAGIAQLLEEGMDWTAVGATAPATAAAAALAIARAKVEG